MRRWQVGLLSIALLLTARVFQYFPEFSLVQEAAFALAPLALIVIMFKASQVVGETPLLEGYCILLMLLMPVWAGIAAWQVHGQPVIYGVLALRGFGLISVGLAVLYALRMSWLTVEDLSRAFILCAWGTLTLYVLMDLFLDAANFTDYGIGFVEIRTGESTRFKFNSAFIFYALFYYGVRAFHQRQSWLYGISLALFLYMFGSAGGRILTVSILLTALILLLRWGGWRRFAKGLAALSLLTGILVGIGSLLAPAATVQRLTKFTDAFSIFASDAEGIDDASAASRVLQTLIAAPLIEERPLTGNGRISSQWVEDGFPALFGAHFYPDDIGIIGMVYQYGLAGTLLCAMQFAFAWNYARKCSNRKRSLVGDTCAAYLLFLGISSLPTGNFGTFPEFGLLLTVVLAHLGTQSSLAKTRRQSMPP